MFLNSLIKELEKNQRGFQGKSSILELCQIDISELEGRFKLLLAVLSYWTSVGLDSVRDGTTAVPDLGKIKRTLIGMNEMSHNTSVMGHALKIVAQELSFEIVEATNGKGDVSIIADVFTGKKKFSDFLAIKEKVTKLNKVFSFKGKSGKDYVGKGVQDLMSFNTEDFIDIVEGLKIDKKIKEILLDKEVMKKEFKSHRAGIMGYMKSIVDTETGKGKVTEFIESQLK